MAIARGSAFVELSGMFGRHVEFEKRAAMGVAVLSCGAEASSAAREVGVNVPLSYTFGVLRDLFQYA